MGCLGKVYIDIDESDANELMYEDRDFDWCFPVYDDNNEVIGYVDIALGRNVISPDTKVVRLAGDGEGRLKGEN